MCDQGPLGREGAPLMVSGAFAVALVDVYQNKFDKFKFDLKPGSLTDQVAGEHQPSKKHP